MLSAVAILVVPAAAQAACPTTQTTKAFQAFGDNNDYSLVPNGGFETGTSGWSLSGAAVTAGNEPWSVRGAGDTEVARHHRGRRGRLADRVRRPQPSDLPLLREAHERSWGVLDLRVRWQDSSGHTNETTIAALDSNFGTAGARRPR